MNENSDQTINDNPMADSPVLDISFQIRQRDLSPEVSTVFFVLGLMCIPRTAVGIFTLWLGLNPEYGGGMGINLAAAAFIFGIVIPVLIAFFGIRMWTYKQNVHMIFYDDRIEVIGKKNTVSVNISRISRIEKKRGIYNLYLEGRKALSIGETDGGTSAAVEKFLKEKTGLPVNIDRKG